MRATVSSVDHTAWARNRTPSDGCRSRARYGRRPLQPGVLACSRL